MNGKVLHRYPHTAIEECSDLIVDLKVTPKTGLHNPFRNKERYLMLAEVNRKVV